MVNFMVVSVMVFALDRFSSIILWFCLKDFMGWFLMP